MGYEQNIVCDQCGTRRAAQQNVVPQNWMSLSGGSIELNLNHAVFCGPGCVVKWIEAKTREQEPR